MPRKHHLSIVLLSIFALILICMVFGCATAPTKEMADAKVAIDAAKAANAGKYAPGALKSAETSLAEGMKSMERKEYEEAKKLALSAKGQAITAKEKAETEAGSAKAKAEIAIAKANEAAQVAEKEEGKVFADKEFSSAKDILMQAKAAFDSGNYEEAKDIATLAEKQFIAAAEVAKKMAQAKTAADRAIADAEEMSKEAEAGGGKIFAESEFASARELLEEAKASYLNRNYEEAKEEAISAKQGFVLAQDTATRRASEKQDKERLEKLRAEAEWAITEAQKAAAEANAAGAKAHAVQLYQAAQGQLEAAKDSFSREQYEEAKKLGLAAQSQFVEATKAAPLLAAVAAAKEEAVRVKEEAVRVEANLRAEAEAARAEAVQAKAEAEAAKAEAEQAKSAYAAAKDESVTAKAEAGSMVQAAHAEAEQAKASYAVAQEEAAAAKAEAGSMVQAAQAEAEQAKASYAAAQDEAAAAKAEAGSMIQAAKAEAEQAKAEAESAKGEAVSGKAEADQAKAAYAAAQDELAKLKAQPAAVAPSAEVEALQAEAEQAKAAYAAAQDEIARLKAEAPAVPTAELEAAKAEAETAKAAYAAAPDEAAAAKAEPERYRTMTAQEREKFEAEKVIMEAEAAEGVAAAKGAKRYALEDYQKGQALLTQAKDVFAASAFPEAMESARQATRLFHMASAASSRAHEAEIGALKTASDRALAEERERGIREKEKAVAEERERCATEKEALAKQPKAEAPKPTEAAKPEKPPAYHKVTKGECLWKIAQEIYGDPYQWPLIFHANRNKIRSPHLIYPRQNLKIPQDVSQEEIQRAKKEASEKPWPEK